MSFQRSGLTHDFLSESVGGQFMHGVRPPPRVLIINRYVHVRSRAKLFRRVSVISVKRLLPDLRQTTCECVCFRSRDKDGGHTMRSATAKKSHAARKLRGSSIEPELLPIKGLHGGNKEFCQWHH